jgi:hypothetical protein
VLGDVVVDVVIVVVVVVVVMVISSGSEDLVKAKAAVVHDVFDDGLGNWALNGAEVVADKV